MKSISPQLYVQKPLPIEAIQVTRDNMRLVAEWCNGTIQSDRSAKNFIRVPVVKPLSNIQTKAYVGCWVTKSKNGFKVYTDTAWRKGFMPAPEESDPAAVKLLEDIFGGEEKNGLLVGPKTIKIVLPPDIIPPHACPECENAKPGELCVNLKAAIDQSLQECVDAALRFANRQAVVEVEEAILHGVGDVKVRGGWMQKVIDDVRPKMIEETVRNVITAFDDNNRPVTISGGAV